MLSSVLRSDTAIKSQYLYHVRAFVGIRQIQVFLPCFELQQVKELKAYIEEAFADYNDINEDTVRKLLS